MLQLFLIYSSYLHYEYRFKDIMVEKLWSTRYYMAGVEIAYDSSLSRICFGSVAVRYKAIVSVWEPDKFIYGDNVFAVKVDTMCRW